MNDLVKTIRRGLKRGLQQASLTRLPPVIVASMGRSGSTLIFKAIRDAYSDARFGPDSKFGRRMVSDEAWDLDRVRYRRGVVYKTHGFAHELPPNAGAKVIFLVGSASDAALSVLACRDSKGPQWIADHLLHLRAQGSFDELATRDVLRFGEQLDSWTGPHDAERLILHYDALWDCVDVLSEFVGVSVKLPPRRARSGAVAADAKTTAIFRATYAELDARIEAMSAYRIIK